MITNASAMNVSLTPITDRLGEINWADIQWENEYSQQASYGQSKTANLLFIKAPTERLAAAGSKITATAAHPGIAQTNLAASNIMGKWLWLIKLLLMLDIGPKIHRAAMGALPKVYAATAEIETGAKDHRSAQQWCYFESVHYLAKGPQGVAAESEWKWRE